MTSPHPPGIPVVGCVFYWGWGGAQKQHGCRALRNTGIWETWGKSWSLGFVPQWQLLKQDGTWTWGLQISWPAQVAEDQWHLLFLAGAMSADHPRVRASPCLLGTLSRAILQSHVLPMTLLWHNFPRGSQLLKHPEECSLSKKCILCRPWMWPEETPCASAFSQLCHRALLSPYQMTLLLNGHQEHWQAGCPVHPCPKPVLCHRGACSKETASLVAGNTTFKIPLVKSLYFCLKCVMDQSERQERCPGDE